MGITSMKRNEKSKDSTSPSAYFPPILKIRTQKHKKANTFRCKIVCIYLPAIQAPARPQLGQTSTSGWWYPSS